MAFLAPLFLAGALAAAVPVVLHLLKREPENVVRFAAVHLLQRAPVEHSSRRRLRELLLLALRVAAMLLLAAAFARPFFASNIATSGATTVVALDTSLSMSAPGQFEKARRLARQAIANAGGGMVAVVTFADGARVASQPSGDRAAALAAVDAAEPGAGGTRFRAGLNAAVDLLRGRPGSIVVVTDLQETGWDSGDRVTVPDSVTVEVADVGAPPANLAVTTARVVDGRVVATVRNAGPNPVSARVHLNLHDAADSTTATQLAGESAVPVGAGQTASVNFAVPRSARWASVSVDDPTGVVADNARFVVLDTASRPTVLIVATSGDLSRDAFYLEQALGSAGADGRAFAVEGVAAGALTTWDQARLDAHTAVVLTSTRALEHRGRELLTAYLKKGGGMLVAAGPDVDGDELREVLAGPRLSIVDPGVTQPGTRVTRTWGASDVRHPALRALGAALGRVQFHRVSTVRADDCPVLARFTSSEPALLECASGEGRALVVASDLDNRGNDFPLHATFVPFLHESLRYLSGGQQGSAEYFVADVPAGISPVPGVAAIPGGRAGSLVAVNIDPAETDPGRLTPDEFKGAVTILGGGAQAGALLQAHETEERQHIWQYVLAAMLAAMIMESWLAAKAA